MNCKIETVHQTMTAEAVFQKTEVSVTLIDRFKKKTEEISTYDDNVHYFNNL